MAQIFCERLGYSWGPARPSMAHSALRTWTQQPARPTKLSWSESSMNWPVENSAGSQILQRVPKNQFKNNKSNPDSLIIHSCVCVDCIFICCIQNHISILNRNSMDTQEESHRTERPTSQYTISAVQSKKKQKTPAESVAVQSVNFPRHSAEIFKVGLYRYIYIYINENLN